MGFEKAYQLQSRDIGEEFWSGLRNAAIPPTYVTWRAGTTNKDVVPVRQAGNRFLGSLKGLQIRVQATQVGRSPTCGLSWSIYSSMVTPILWQGWLSCLFKSKCVYGGLAGYRKRVKALGDLKESNFFIGLFQSYFLNQWLFHKGTVIIRYTRYIV